MRIARVTGTVTLNRCHPTFDGVTLKLVQPLSLDNLTGAKPASADELVTWDDFGAGLGSQIAISEGGEAAQAFRPLDKPVDTYNAAILDAVSLMDSKSLSDSSLIDTPPAADSPIAADSRAADRTDNDAAHSDNSQQPPA